ncbi:hypothetical protein [Yoonia sp.]|uniref:portal protein n=1 Tax=Yoonia sp. TaxID=2212373 RepID=UPI002DF941AC|nr:hypothetical protein [Yoonia sp.]
MDNPPNQIETKVKPNQRPEDRVKVPSSSLLGDVPKAVRSDIDSGFAKELHDRMIGHYLRELEVQGPSRRLMEKDEAFYDHDQWEQEALAILEKRGQEPLTYNVIAQSINWVLGTERRTRTDYKILPRNKQALASAEKKSHLLKYLGDVNKTEFHISRSFADATKVGIGWIESGIQDDTEGEPVYERYESWRNIIYDTAASEQDLSDARFIFRTKWVDVDTACAMFPDRKGIVEASTSSHAEWGAFLDRHGDEPMDSQEYASEQAAQQYNSIEHGSYTRDRVRLIEAWFKIPTMEQRMAGGEFTGEIYDPESLGHQVSVSSGMAEVRPRLTQRVYVMVMTLTGVLWMSPSPYRHNKYPFTPIWGYRKAKDSTPYGIIRGMISAQKDINKRLSKALAIINSNKVIMDKGAVDDMDEFEEEVGRPDAIIVANPGKRLELNADRDLASAHIDIMNLSMSMVQTLSGITDESMGRTTNATSGRAINARQEQGAMSTAAIFDNLRYARQIHGEKTLSLIEQFMTEEKQFRITNRRGSPDWVTVNDGMPENDIVQSKADYIISEDAWNASLRQAAVQQFMELLTQVGPVAPDIVMVLLDLIVEMMDLPSGDEVVNRIRQITGMEDPDADPNAPDPEREKREQAKLASQEMQGRAAQANLAKLEGEAAEKMARAEKAKADALKVLKGMPGENIKTQKDALELALQMLASQPAMPVVDNVLNRSGYQSPQDEARAAAQAEQQAMAEQEQAIAAEEQAMAEAQQQQPQQAMPMDGEVI